MILIADGGSTKTSWCLIESSDKQDYFQTEGYNPYFVSVDFIVESLQKNTPSEINRSDIKEIYFYGAGCSADKAPVLEEALKIIFPHSQPAVHLDLLAAARALLGFKPGFAAILGTGTNTCTYDGRDIIQNIDSLGFVMGDEGSGATIGRKLLSDYMRGYMPEKTSRQFRETYRLTADEIMHQIYTQPMANRFCADFCKFVSRNMEQEYFYRLVRSSFDEFFKNLVCGYTGYQNYSFNCTGSIAFAFRNILEQSARHAGMEMGKVIRTPIEGLVDYHINLALQSPV